MAWEKKKKRPRPHQALSSPVLPISLLSRPGPPYLSPPTQDLAAQDLVAFSSDGRAHVFPAFLLQRLRLGPRRLSPSPPTVRPKSSRPSSLDGRTAQDHAARDLAAFSSDGAQVFAFSSDGRRPDLAVFYLHGHAP
ncbi:hypothetical protein QYE76_070918 [Lolium multiflorum]|uniref:Uncharacterized protein n=1 Tax=Lolium multiflorum TaxID=4521 RepID=A0AAD8SKP4_LOLMU|nr:hypothetical protein QYE76_070918 [Lolium multiflorum]